ncbi:hypothetical protein CFP56_022430, partial [Quercus suber]
MREWRTFVLNVVGWDMSKSDKMLNEPQGFGPWMRVETQGKRTSRWVEFLSKICNENVDSNLEPTRSSPSTAVDEVEH